ncbi:MAG: SLBB domain-containing protein [candidate division Zixibacteria bacterium]|nr:SLBB domain-containing protein [candidate division Zixibacteria bacterium]
MKRRITARENAGDREIIPARTSWGMPDTTARDPLTRQLPELERVATYLLDQKVDPEEYHVGPGDIFFINFRGGLSDSYQSIVTPEGVLLLPVLGPVEVSGISLAGAKERIMKKIMSHYSGVEITATLIGLRRFLVPVAGDVNYPGTYPVYASQRASDAILAAGGVLDQASKRNIMLRRSDGSVRWIDLEMFERTGNRKRNPYLREGDVIFVPIQEKKFNRVGVYGAVRAPGEFEFCPGDSLFDLIELGQGLRDDAILEDAELVRQNLTESGTYSIKLDLEENFAANPGPSNMALEPGDKLLIRFASPSDKIAHATIYGEVNRPGAYLIQSDSTRLSELVNMAGGLTEFASLPEAALFRSSTAGRYDVEYERMLQVPPDRLTEDELEYIKLVKNENMGRVSADFTALFAGEKALDPRLIDGDSVYIPSFSRMVEIVGQVVRPGLVSFSNDFSTKEYIRLAGGFSDGADQGKMFLIKGGTGEWTKPSKGRGIEAGDILWVPRKPERKFWPTVKDVLLTVGSVATTFWVVREATR